MNAAAVLNRTDVDSAETDSAETDSARTDDAGTPSTWSMEPVPVETEHSSTGFGKTMGLAVGLSVVVVWAVVAVAMTAYNGEVWAAIGLGAYLAVWLGLGFGFLAGGIAWALAQEDLQH